MFNFITLMGMLFLVLVVPVVVISMIGYAIYKVIDCLMEPTCKLAECKCNGE